MYGTYVCRGDIGGANEYHLKHDSVAVYYRLELSNIILDFDKIIYLDVDTIVHKDLTEFYNLDMKNYYFLIMILLIMNLMAKEILLILVLCQLI